jgi:sugar/nucleoside kinase (ribokinase family)
VLTVFIGDVALDEYFQAERWPGLHDKVGVEALPARIGGMIANAACVHAGYGAATEMVSVLNSGAVSDLLRGGLEKAGVGTAHLQVDDSLADSRVLIFLVGGEHAVLIPEIGEYTIDVGPELLAEIRSASFVYSTISQVRRLRLAPHTPVEILRLMKEKGTRLAFDLDVNRTAPEDHELLALADVVFVNDIGFEALRAGRPGAEAVGDLLNLGIGILIVTHGPGGCTVNTPADTFRIPGVAVSPVDVTGAGDTFGSTFVYGLGRTSDLRLVASFANAAAARSVTRMGAQSGVTTAREILAFMAEHQLLLDGDFTCFT